MFCIYIYIMKLPAVSGCGIEKIRIKFPFRIHIFLSTSLVLDPGGAIVLSEPFEHARLEVSVKRIVS